MNARRITAIAIGAIGATILAYIGETIATILEVLK